MTRKRLYAFYEKLPYKLSVKSPKIFKKPSWKGIALIVPYLGDLVSVYTGPDLFGTGTKLVLISLVFTRDLVDPVRIGSVIWYQMGRFMKVILCGTVPFQFRTGPV